MKNILILEASQSLAEQTRLLVQVNFPEINCSTCTDLIEAQKLALTDYRSVFCINLERAQGTGLEFAVWLRKIPVYRQTPIIFCAVGVEQSVAAINQVKCLNYILRPNLESELPKALAEAFAVHAAGGTDSDSEFISLNTKGARFKVKLEDIVYIEVNNKIVHVITTEHRFELKRVPLQEIVDQLPQMMFQQCHRSFIINIKCISSVETSGRTTVLRLKNIEQLIPVGTRYVEKFVSR